MDTHYVFIVFAVIHNRYDILKHTFDCCKRIDKAQVWFIHSHYIVMPCIEPRTVVLVLHCYCCYHFVFSDEKESAALILRFCCFYTLNIFFVVAAVVFVYWFVQNLPPSFHIVVWYSIFVRHLEESGAESSQWFNNFKESVKSEASAS